MIQLTEIGMVESRFREKTDPFQMRKHRSRIVLKEEFRDGLKGLSQDDHIQVLFGFHLSEGHELVCPVYNGSIRGVFASRSPNRPNGMGVTTVKILAIEGNVLTVQGLDAVDGTPVYDIKIHASVFDEEEIRNIDEKRILENPREEMIRLIRAGDTQGPLREAGKIHGHYCPGLSLGVGASVHAMKKMFGTPSDGMEKLLAVVEVNSCFSDGIQVVSGCTFGNNSLIYRDTGKTAVTFLVRGNDTGLRVRVKPGFRELLQCDFPEFSRLFDIVVRQRAGSGEDAAAFRKAGREASFGILSYEFGQIHEEREVPVTPPPYAPMVESLVCMTCGEEFMGTKAVEREKGVVCRTCAEIQVPSVTGAGIGCGFLST